MAYGGVKWRKLAYSKIQSKPMKHGGAKWRKVAYALVGDLGEVAYVGSGPRRSGVKWRTRFRQQSMTFLKSGVNWRKVA